MRAIREAGVDADFYALRERPLDEALPWDHINVGVKKGLLIKEYKEAMSRAVDQ